LTRQATKPKRSKATGKDVEIIPPEKPRFTPFVPGHRINAKENLPKGRFITAQLIRMMHEEIDDPDFDPNDKTKVKMRAKAIYFFCRKLMTMALQGDVTCLKMVMDRIEGTPISTTIFKATDDPDNVTPEQSQALSVTREKLANMTYEQQLALYNSTLNDSSGAAAN
jgi:hypothetical protein